MQRCSAGPLSDAVEKARALLGINLRTSTTKVSAIQLDIQ